VHLTGLIFVRSGANLVVFGVIFGALSYMRTQRFRRQTGMNPWGIPPVVWGVVSFFIALLGTLLSLVACATTKPRSAGSAPGGSPYGGHPAAGYGPTPGYGPGPGPGYGAGRSPGHGTGQAWGSPGAGMPGPAGVPGTTSPATASPMSAPAGPGTVAPSWHPDPTGRHQHRYWDGEQWTHHVSNNGDASLDPV